MSKQWSLFPLLRVKTVTSVHIVGRCVPKITTDHVGCLVCRKMEQTDMQTWGAQKVVFCHAWAWGTPVIMCVVCLGITIMTFKDFMYPVPWKSWHWKYKHQQADNLFSCHSRRKYTDVTNFREDTFSDYYVIRTSRPWFICICIFGGRGEAEGECLIPSLTYTEERGARSVCLDFC
jgi:hypothetical protein